jgi:hypothetical protein
MKILMKYTALFLSLTFIACNNLDNPPEAVECKAHCDSLQNLLDSCRVQQIVQKTSGNNSPIIVSDTAVNINY